MRLEGHTLQEIGDRFGVTRQRVSQLLGAEPAVADIKRGDSKRAQESDRDARGREAEILDAWGHGDSISVIAERFAIQKTSVERLIKESASPLDRASRSASLARKSGASELKYTDDELFEAIRRVAIHFGETPSVGQYRSVSRLLKVPSQATIIKRMSWLEAVRGAGLEPRGKGRGSYSRRWTEETVLAALRIVAAEEGGLPTYAAYCQLAKARADLPSGPTVRNRLGKWSELALLLASDSPDPQEDQNTRPWDRDEKIVLVAASVWPRKTTDGEVERSLAEDFRRSVPQILYKLGQVSEVLEGAPQSSGDEELRDLVYWFNLDSDRGITRAREVAEQRRWEHTIGILQSEPDE